jgi:hypothetical protein
LGVLPSRLRALNRSAFSRRAHTWTEQVQSLSSVVEPAS